MKYCLSSRQSVEYLTKADEILVQERDHKQIPDLFEKYPDATVILTLLSNNYDNIPLKQYNILSKGKLVVMLENFSNINIIKDLDIPFYYGYPVNNFYDLDALKELGVCYVKLAPPLTHLLQKVKAYEIPIRMVANEAYQSYLPHKDGVCGGYIRPEDVDAYAQYVDAIEFDECDLKKEQTLFRIYAEQKAWPGELQMIIEHLNYPGTNRMIDPKISQMRLNCGQKCKEGRRCSICYNMLNLANPEKVREYAKDVLNMEV